MKTTQEFIDAFVHIDLIENTGLFGHYPFQMVSANDKNEATVAALCLGGDVVAVYKAAALAIKNGAKQLFLSIDFPAMLDIKSDFVAVYSWIEAKLECIVIPYDTKTGERFEPITSGLMIEQLKRQFSGIVCKSVFNHDFN